MSGAPSPFCPPCSQAPAPVAYHYFYPMPPSYPSRPSSDTNFSRSAPPHQQQNARETRTPHSAGPRPGPNTLPEPPWPRSLPAPRGHPLSYNAPQPGCLYMHDLGPSRTYRMSDNVAALVARYDVAQKAGGMQTAYLRPFVDWPDS